MAAIRSLRVAGIIGWRLVVAVGLLAAVNAASSTASAQTLPQVIAAGQVSPAEAPVFDKGTSASDADGERSGECLTSGGCSNFNENYPPGTFSTSSSSWTTVSPYIYGGDYSYYNVTSGQTYEWSLCSSDGGNAYYDSQLTLQDPNETTLCFSDDYCDINASKVAWTATFSGVVRVLVSEYSCLSNYTNTTLVWRCASGGGGDTAVIYDAWWTNTVDPDGDGCVYQARLNWDPDVLDCNGTLTVFEKIYCRPPGGSWSLLMTTGNHVISNCPTSDSQYVIVTGSDPCTVWDWKIEIYRAGQASPDYARSDTNDADLNDYDFEGPGEADIRVEPTLINVDCTGRSGADGYRDRPLRDEVPVPIVIDGRPPEGFRMPAVELPRSDGRSTVILPSVPAFDWSFGCSATSAAMLAGYFDRTSHPDMYTGTANGGVCPLHNDGNPIGGPGHCALSATENGLDGRVIRGHVNDYWITYGNTGPDPFIVNGWVQHTHGNCTGDYMGTNQSVFGNSDGGTTFWYYTSGAALHNYDAGASARDGCFGLRLFVESRGYVVADNFTQLIRGQGSDPSAGFTFDDYMAEINAGRPVLIQVSGHTMLGFGYESSTQTVYLHDTWDFLNHQMVWGASYSGLQHWGVTVLQVAGGSANCFVIHNDGGAALNVSSISKPAWVSLSLGPPYQIPPAGDVQVCVTVDCGACNGSDLVGTLQITSNDPDEPTVDVSVEVECGGPPVHVGDIDCDGTYGYLSFGDINPFVLYLSNFSAWQVAYPGCDARNGDINGDGTYGHLSFGDINPFVALLSTPP